MNISEHFTLEELTFSQTALRLGLDNTPSAESIANLTSLCNTLLEPLRSFLATPLHVDSGYRSPEVNKAIGGAANSAHMDGRAADLVPLSIPLSTAFDIIRHSSLPYDQVITECNAWIHIAIAPNGQTPRRMALSASGAPGHWVYTEA